MKQRTTQYAAILAYLRKYTTATTWELSQAARSLSVHKRIDEMTGNWGRTICAGSEPGESITRSKLKVGGRYVTLYRLVRA